MKKHCISNKINEYKKLTKITLFDKGITKVSEIETVNCENSVRDDNVDNQDDINGPQMMEIGEIKD